MKYSVKIQRMCESSGNVQFYVYAIDNDQDNTDIFNSNMLNFSCHQSKHYDFNTEEPLERATYDATKLLKFFLLKKEDLILPETLTKDELKVVNDTFEFWRFN